ncbi:hypothetical protein GCM10010981_43690 [Dyella nitratireducens]|uniref:Uncharacterized protein n=1 Tax=Dyella nitratireducens TaxID=1849580 RepID=A0ABQ1GUC9_9GAMM|nr:hypothetical protein GCM10010981_43690 [Dyella nitratireducens]GLQ42484.1 hypothetical protein GCM10007902_23340 [Dyella nitratireducens]
MQDDRADAVEQNRKDHVDQGERGDHAESVHGDLPGDEMHGETTPSQIVGWGANPNIAILVDMAVLGFAPQPTRLYNDLWRESPWPDTGSSHGCPKEGRAANNTSNSLSLVD